MIDPDRLVAFGGPLNEQSAASGDISHVTCVNCLTLPSNGEDRPDERG